MRKLFAAVAITFFVLPTALWAAGVRARPFENRRMASAPKVADGWKAFDGATRFFVDRLPLREQAVRANTWASVHVFDTTPDYSRNAAGGNPTNDALPFGQPAQPEKPKAVQRTAEGGAPGVGVQPAVGVLEGRDGWLFLEAELSAACTYFISWRQAVRRWERMVSIIRASGRRVVFALVPDKATIYPEFLPDTFKEKDCLAKGRKHVWDTIEATKDPGVLGLRKAMLAGKGRTTKDSSYYPKGTHWGTKGAVQAVRTVLERLGGDVQLRDSEIVKSSIKYSGDLADLRGAPEQGTSPDWTISRPLAPTQNATEKIGAKAKLEIRRRVAGGAPLIPGRTLFVYDSFGVAMQAALASYTRELASVLWYATPPSELMDAIAGSDTVILEKVERDTNYLASDQGVVTPAFLDKLERRLRRR
jgi:alginate O-acetyltransferase complex protein AlgJ